MPFALFVIGLLLVITSVQDTYVQFGQQAKADAKGFALWALAIVMAGALGYVEKLRPFSSALMALVLIVLLLKNGTVFSKLLSDIKAGGIAPARPATNTPSVSDVKVQAIGDSTTNLAKDALSKNLPASISDIGKITLQFLTGF